MHHPPSYEDVDIEAAWSSDLEKAIVTPLLAMDDQDTPLLPTDSQSAAPLPDAPQPAAPPEENLPPPFASFLLVALVALVVTIGTMHAKYNYWALLPCVGLSHLTNIFCTMTAHIYLSAIFDAIVGEQYAQTPFARWYLKPILTWTVTSLWVAVYVAHDKPIMDHASFRNCIAQL